MAGSNQYTQSSTTILIVRGISDKVRRICVGQVVLQAVPNARWVLESKYVATSSRKIRASGLSMQEGASIGPASETLLLLRRRLLLPLHYYYYYYYHYY